MMTTSKKARGWGHLALAMLILPGGAAASAQTTTAPVPEVTVTRVAGGRVLVEVADAGVSVRKEVAGDASHVVIATATDELQVRVEKGRMVVSTPAGSVTVAGGRAADMAQLLAMLQKSEAAAHGLALLRRVPADARHFGQQSLLLTRAVLELGGGSSEAIGEHRRWVVREQARLQAGPARLQVTRVSLEGQIRGPGDCWDLYAQEAVRIAEDFAECTDGLRWYDVLDWAACSLIYTVRAEGAMAWFIACNGGVPFNG